MTELLPLTPDELLTTTPSRAQAARPRPAGEREVVEECIEIALQAPSGSNRQAWQWIPVDDPDTKVAHRRAVPPGVRLLPAAQSGYAEGDTRVSAAMRDGVVGPPARPPPRGARAARRVPGGSYRGLPPAPSRASGVRWCRPSGASCWRRARGLGSVWTTMTCRREPEMAELLGVRHDEYTQIGLFPSPTRSAPTSSRPRLDPTSVIHWNRW